MKEYPLVGIVIVNFNGREFMADCIESIKAQDYSNQLPVLVDNASTDGTREWIAALPSDFEKVLLDENTGVTGGNNAGILRCLELGCDEIFVLNNDTVLLPDAVSKLVAARSPSKMLTPRTYSIDEPPKVNTYFGDFDFIRGISLQRFFGEADSARTEKPSEGTMASLCALMFPASMIADVGLMDDLYFMYFDDVDFVARAVRHGYKVQYVPEAKLYHRESGSSGGETLGPLPLYYQTRNRMYFMVKHQSNRLKLALFFAYFGGTRLAHVARWLIKRDRRSLYAFRAAIEDYRAGKLGYAPPARFVRESRS
ncbi:glycosyltransferase family 2 protein [soil metagenome]